MSLNAIFLIVETKPQSDKINKYRRNIGGLRPHLSCPITAVFMGTV